MKLTTIFLSAALIPSVATATTTQCESNKYHQYVDASLVWYQNLVDLAIKHDPSLKEVGNWFLEGRKHHFEFNRQAVDWYLKNDKDKLALNQSVESWLQLTQQDIKKLSAQDTALGKTAKIAFDDRQNKPHPKNYDLRSTFAGLLTNPKDIEGPLTQYNAAITAISDISCQ